MKIVDSPPLLGLMATLVMDGAVLSTVTGELVRGMPESMPSVGVAVHSKTSPALKSAPSMVWVVTVEEVFTVHCQV